MLKDINILFFNPNPRPDWTKDKTMLYFPLGMCNVASAVERQGYNYDILDLCVNPLTDSEIEDFVGRKEYDVIAFPGLTHAYCVIKPLVNIMRKVQPDALIIAGNVIAQSIPARLVLLCSCYCRGTGSAGLALPR